MTKAKMYSQSIYSAKLHVLPKADQKLNKNKTLHENKKVYSREQEKTFDADTRKQTLRSLLLSCQKTLTFREYNL